ncbi:HD domain-containing protein [Actinomycetospora endophytica]|uniref:HD domain-containing protein n=1 Tax=Actinomycetospora endophytica TaxID=2291215 RepID=A0ABS8P5Q2_9PSEU|nr:HD domain-containing protein [Actinomycetospora endophytica]MCD2193583.1 HD domain-containing protein [Actinomycetospora endophytica]
MLLAPLDAEEWARSLLAAALPRRWSHVVAVAQKARVIGRELGEDGRLLEATAWVHDVGYAPSTMVTGFHPLDGARYLLAHSVSERIASLVAFHSSARAEAVEFGVATDLVEFQDERTLTRDLLWYCDMTTGPDGTDLDFEDRMTEVRQRYGPDHYVTRALDGGMKERRSAVYRSRDWLMSVGLADQV